MSAVHGRILPPPASSGWSSRQSDAWLAGLANLLLVIWLAWQLADLSWLLVSDPVDPQPVEAGTNRDAPVSIRQSRPAIDEREIAGWHLFGIAGEQQPNTGAPVDAPDTALKLTLRGVLASIDLHAARAIVADPGGQDRTYRIGDLLPGDATLTAVHSDRIILERNGRFETLRLLRERLDAPDPVGQPDPGAARQVSPIESGAPQGTVPAFFDVLQLRLERRNGWFIGYRIGDAVQASDLEAAGLQPGDVITGVNGARFENPDSARQAIDAAGKDGYLNLSVQRAGEGVELSLVPPIDDSTPVP